MARWRERIEQFLLHACLVGGEEKFYRREIFFGRRTFSARRTFSFHFSKSSRKLVEARGSSREKFLAARREIKIDSSSRVRLRFRLLAHARAREMIRHLRNVTPAA